MTTEQELMSSVMQDMQNRRGEVGTCTALSSESEGGNNELFTLQVDSSSIGTGTLKGLVPMAELVGYR